MQVTTVVTNIQVKRSINLDGCLKKEVKTSFSNANQILKISSLLFYLFFQGKALLNKY